MDLVTKCVVATVSGIVIGVIIELCYQKFKKKKREEPLEVITYDEIMRGRAQEEDEGEPIPPSKEEKETYADILNQYSSDDIEIISPDSFGDMYENTVSCSYYDDGILSDENDEMYSTFDVIKYFGGVDISKHFGEYEDDSVHIRNHPLKTDFEILREGCRWDDNH